MSHIDLEQLDRELGLDDDFDEYDELEMLADRLSLDRDRLGELEAFIGIAGIVITGNPDGKVTAVRKCLDCDQPARPRKSANGRWPVRCELHTKERKRYMVNGGSKAREPYRQCCVTWQMDDNPAHTGLCRQCRDARKASHGPVGDREASWLANTLGPSGWNIQKAGWLRE
jgi:hypothetical protein